jgi:hypothetical protein
VDRNVRTGSIPVSSTKKIKNMANFCIIKNIKTNNGVELPVIMLDAYDEVWEFDDLNEAKKIADILTKNSDSGHTYYVRKI